MKYKNKCHTYVVDKIKNISEVGLPWKVWELLNIEGHILISIIPVLKKISFKYLIKKKVYSTILL